MRKVVYITLGGIIALWGSSVLLDQFFFPVENDRPKVSAPIFPTNPTRGPKQDLVAMTAPSLTISPPESLDSDIATKLQNSSSKSNRFLTDHDLHFESIVELMHDDKRRASLGITKEQIVEIYTRYEKLLELTTEDTANKLQRNPLEKINSDDDLSNNEQAGKKVNPPFQCFNF